ncbi:hypothetical protein HQ535_10810 [bacterium]|nr:hypothetical protein [bacterium]
MRRAWILAMCLAVGAAAAGCGDDDDAATTTTPAPVEQTTTVAPATTAESGTTVASVTTESSTTAAPQTTVPQTTVPQTSTTLPADAHQAMGVGWSAIWPADGATAVYRVVTRDGVEANVPARIDYSVDWRGGEWDKISLGEVGGELPALAIYVRKIDPWVIEVGAIENLAGSAAGEQDLFESYAEPVLIDLSGGIGESYEVETTVTIEFSNDTFEADVTYVITLESVSEAMSLDFGDLDGVSLWSTRVSGPFVGGDTILLGQFWMHPEYFIVGTDSGLVFAEFVLVEPWE